MIKQLLLCIPRTHQPDSAKTPFDALMYQLQFEEDKYGVSHWIMRLPMVIYSHDRTIKYTFTTGHVRAQPCKDIKHEERCIYFVITKADGTRVYCAAQIFYECKQLKKSAKSTGASSNQLRSQEVLLISDRPYEDYFVPKCMVLMSEQPYFTIQQNLLRIYSKLNTGSPELSHIVDESVLQFYNDTNRMGRQDQWETVDLQSLRNSLSHNHLIKLTPQLEVIFKYYLDCCNDHEKGWKIFEQRIGGKKKLVLQLYKLQKDEFFQLTKFFHMPLSAEVIRLALSAILQEKQIVFVGQNPNLNVLIIETLMQLIRPLQWCFFYVPNMPSHMIEAAEECPTPFIIGVTPSTLQKLNTNGKVIIEVEQNKCTGSISDLNLISPPLDKYLNFPTYTAQHSYLEWEISLRINCLLLICELLEDFFHYASPKIASILGPQGSHLIEPYQELLNRSMIYRHLRNNITLCHSFSTLIKMSGNERKQYISSSFAQTLSLIMNPEVIDNQKNWIAYYDKNIKGNSGLSIPRLSRTSNSHISQLQSSNYRISAGSSTNLGSNHLQLRGSQVDNQMTQSNLGMSTIISSNLSGSGLTSNVSSTTNIGLKSNHHMHGHNQGLALQSSQKSAHLTSSQQKIGSSSSIKPPSHQPQPQSTTNPGPSGSRVQSNNSMKSSTFQQYQPHNISPSTIKSTDRFNQGSSVASSSITQSNLSQSTHMTSPNVFSSATPSHNSLSSPKFPIQSLLNSSQQSYVMNSGNPHSFGQVQSFDMSFQGQQFLNDMSKKNNKRALELSLNNSDRAGLALVQSMREPKI